MVSDKQTYLFYFTLCTWINVSDAGKKDRQIQSYTFPFSSR